MEDRTINMSEEWTKMEEDIIPKGKFIATSLIQNSDGTTILLDDEENIVEVFFDGIPTFVRSTVEGARMRTWGEIQKKYQDKFFFQNWFLFYVENSKISKWIEEESCGFYEAEHLKHFCIVTSEEIIDIVASFNPIVKVSKYKKH